MKIDLLELFEVNEDFDQKSVNALIKAINQAHLQEFDYLKFKTSVQNLKEIEPDEKTRIKTTFTTAETLGISKKYLLDTARHYQNVLKKEKEKFSTALHNKMNKDIEGKKEEAVRIEEEIAIARRKMEQLMKDIKALEGRAGSIDSEVEEAKNRIQETRDKFAKALDHFERIIMSDMDKINEIL